MEGLSGSSWSAGIHSWATFQVRYTLNKLKKTTLSDETVDHNTVNHDLHPDNDQSFVKDPIYERDQDSDTTDPVFQMRMSSPGGQWAGVKVQERSVVANGCTKVGHPVAVPFSQRAVWGQLQRSRDVKGSSRQHGTCVFWLISTNSS